MIPSLLESGWFLSTFQKKKDSQFTKRNSMIPSSRESGMIPSLFRGGIIPHLLNGMIPVILSTEHIKRNPS